MDKFETSHLIENTARPAKPYTAAREIDALPPDHICNAYWKYNRASSIEIDKDPTIVDFKRGLNDEQNRKIKEVGIVSSRNIANSYKEFSGYFKTEKQNDSSYEINPPSCTFYNHQDFPGLRLYPFLLPPKAQLLLVSKIMHRDLANSNHKTNINLSYQVPYPTAGPTSSTNHAPDPSFFTFRQCSENQMLLPKISSPERTSKAKDEDQKMKPLNMSQFLHKKLRWLTLGDQYQWSTRSYSGADITPFPPDISKLVTGLFEGLRPESGVVLLYSKTDFMPIHRDVSELCTRGLVSISLGCDGIFVVAKDTTVGEEKQEKNVLAIRVRSGDVIQMAEETRWAWHAMPKIMAGTCPEFMKDWPEGSEVDTRELKGAYQKWKGYMAGKRINLSCRQVWD